MKAERYAFIAAIIIMAALFYYIWNLPPRPEPAYQVEYKQACREAGGEPVHNGRFYECIK